jgi:hypothetical protein
MKKGPGGGESSWFLAIRGFENDWCWSKMDGECEGDVRWEHVVFLTFGMS